MAKSRKIKFENCTFEMLIIMLFITVASVHRRRLAWTHHPPPISYLLPFSKGCMICAGSLVMGPHGQLSPFEERQQLQAISSQSIRMKR